MRSFVLPRNASDIIDALGLMEAEVEAREAVSTIRTFELEAAERGLIKYGGQLYIFFSRKNNASLLITGRLFLPGRPC